MPRVTTTYLARNLADVINRVAYRGEWFTVERGKRAVAELGPPLQSRTLSDLPSLVEGLPALSETERWRFAAEIELARQPTTAVREKP